MNQLTGKYANVVLSIEEGRSMDFIKNEIYISVCLNNRVLESDRARPGERALFNTELIWETEKKELRKIRIANQPLRVECVSIDGYNRKERVGFALLSLRSAPVIGLKDAGTPAPFRWQKLIGCQADKKKYHPELYLSLSIRDHLLNDSEDIPQNMPFINEEEPSTLAVDSPYPVKYLDGGHIQIGVDAENLQPYAFNLHIKEARNLDTLLPEILVFQQNTETYYLSFMMFGVAIKTKPFRKDLHKTITLNEKVVVRILSTLETLSHFLKSAAIVINFYCGPDKLGVTQFALDTVSFKEHKKDCFFKFPSPNGIVPFENKENAPVIEVKTWLSTEKSSVTEDEFSPNKVISNIHDKPSGDGNEVEYPLDKLGKVTGKSRSEIILAEPTEALQKTNSAETFVRNIPLSPRTAVFDISDTYRKFSLCITLNSVFWKKPPNENSFILKFFHPRCASYVNISKQFEKSLSRDVPLDKIKVKINYISVEDKILAALNAWPPRLVILTEKEKLLSEEHEMFLEPNSTQIVGLKYEADLKYIRTLEPLAKIYMDIDIETHDIQDNDNDSSLVLTPPLIDEILDYQNLLHLEKWKQTQKDIFESKIVEEKTNEMEALKESWEKEKNTLEENLQTKIQKCRILQEQLQEKLSQLKIEKALAEKRTSSNIFEDIFKENWHRYSKSEPKDIIMALSKLQRDNEYLQIIVKEQERDLKAVERTALTKEQTSKLLLDAKGLEKQFEEAQKAKEYFKEQWRKACEEIHELKTEENKQVQNYITVKKEELRRSSAESIHNDRVFQCMSSENILSSSSNKSICSYFDKI